MVVLRVASLHRFLQSCRWLGSCRNPEQINRGVRRREQRKNRGSATLTTATSYPAMIDETGLRCCREGGRKWKNRRGLRNVDVLQERWFVGGDYATAHLFFF